MKPDALWGRVTERLEAWHRALAAPATGLVLVEPGAEDRYHLIGTADQSSGRGLTARSIFPIGELSEGFVACLAALQVKRGRLKWQDQVVSRLANLRLSDPGLAMRLTLEDLLGHRSGFATAHLLAGGEVSMREIASSLRDAEIFDPEQNFHRSALNYRLALEILSKSAGAPWASLLESQILRPLGLESTGPPGRAIAAEHRVHGHVDAFDDPQSLQEIALPAPGGSSSSASDWAAGHLNSSLGDLARWMKFLLSPETAAELGVEKKDLAELWVARSPIAPGVGFGLGFRVTAHRGFLIVSQSGQNQGVSTTLSLLPELQRGFALVQNLADSPLQERSHRDLWDLLIPEAPPPLVANATFPGAAPEEDLQETPMCFRAEAEELDAMIFSRGRQLFLDVPGQPTLRLEGPNQGGGYYYTERDRVLGTQLVRPSEGEPPESLLLHHFLRFPGFRIPPLRSEARAGQAASITEAERLPGRYRIEHVSLDVDVRLDDGQPMVEIPDDFTYRLKDVAGLGHWLLDSTQIQSIEFHGEREHKGPAHAATWQVIKSVHLLRLDHEPPAVEFAELMALRRQAIGHLLDAGTACVALEGEVSYPYQGIRGEFWQWTSGHRQTRREEDLGRVGQALLQRSGDTVWHRAPGAKAVRELLDAERTLAVADLDLDLALAGCETPSGAAGSSPFRHVKVFDEEFVRGWDCAKVWIQPPFGSPTTLWICQDTGVLVRQVRGIETTDYEDHEEIGGVQIPFKRTTTWAGPRDDRRCVTIDSAEVLAQPPRGVFDPPF